MSRPRYIDRESIRAERVSLALPAKLYEGVSTMAAIRRTSINDLVCSIIAGVVEKNQPVLDDFIAARKKASDAVNLTADD